MIKFIEYNIYHKIFYFLYRFIIFIIHIAINFTFCFIYRLYQILSLSFEHHYLGLGRTPTPQTCAVLSRCLGLPMKFKHHFVHDPCKAYLASVLSFNLIFPFLAYPMRTFTKCEKCNIGLMFQRFSHSINTHEFNDIFTNYK